MTTTAPSQEIVATNEVIAEQGIPKIWQPGSCHCGAVSLEDLHESLYPIPGKTAHCHVINCNCSICLKNGYLMIYPERHELKWLSGWDTMKTYKFETEPREHRFCGTYESSVAIDFMGKRKEGDIVGINQGWFKDLDLNRLNYRKKPYCPQ